MGLTGEVFIESRTSPPLRTTLTSLGTQRPTGRRSVSPPSYTRPSTTPVRRTVLFTGVTEKDEVSMTVSSLDSSSLLLIVSYGRVCGDTWDTGSRSETGVWTRHHRISYTSCHTIDTTVDCNVDSEFGTLLSFFGPSLSSTYSQTNPCHRGGVRDDKRLRAHVSLRSPSRDLSKSVYSDTKEWKHNGYRSNVGEVLESKEKERKVESGQRIHRWHPRSYERNDTSLHRGRSTPHRRRYCPWKQIKMEWYSGEFR